MKDTGGGEYVYDFLKYKRRPISIGAQLQTVTRYAAFHFHNTHEILVISQGRYKVYGPSKLYEGEGACVVFFRRGVYHGIVRVDCETQPFCCHDIYFQQNVLDAIPKHYADTSALFENDDVIVIPLNDKQINFLEPIVERMWESYGEYTTKGEAPHSSLYGFTTVILDYVSGLVDDGAGYHFDTEPDNDNYIADVVKDIICSIDNGEDISATTLAEKYYVSISKLSKDFSKRTGRPIKSFISELRLDRAIRYLEGGASVKDTAMRCGFTSESYFIQFFNKYMNMSPGKYIGISNSDTSSD